MRLMAMQICPELKNLPNTAMATARSTDVQAGSGEPGHAVAAAPAGDVEGRRHQITDLDMLNVPADLDDIPGDFVASTLLSAAATEPE